MAIRGGPGGKTDPRAEGRPRCLVRLVLFMLGIAATVVGLLLIAIVLGKMSPDLETDPRLLGGIVSFHRWTTVDSDLRAHVGAG